MFPYLYFLGSCVSEKISRPLKRNISGNSMKRATSYPLINLSEQNEAKKFKNQAEKAKI